MFNLQKFEKKFSEPELDLTKSSESDSDPRTLPPFLRQDMKEYNEESRDSNNLGNYIEGYFFLKLKKYLKAENDFKGNYSIADHIKKINESIFHFVREKGQDEFSDQIKIKGMNLIQEAENIFNIKADKIQIDSFFPNVKGKIVKKFLEDVEECSYSSFIFEPKIDEQKNYNLVVESTHNILSTLNKKSKQLQNYFTIFSKTRKLYLENKEMLKEFYLRFLRNFKIIDDKENLSHEELMNKSNFIYMICSNKNYESTKLFQESLYDKNQFDKLIKLLSDNKKKKIESNKENAEEKKSKIEGKINSNNTKKINEEENESQNNNGLKKGQKKESISINNEQGNEITTSKKENKEYNPAEYVEKFKSILNNIKIEGDNFLIVYFDSYEKLFVPYPSLMEKINFICNKCLMLEKKVSNVEDFIKTHHPEFCTEKGDIDYKKIFNEKKAF